jgi:hypothetical protein
MTVVADSYRLAEWNHGRHFVADSLVAFSLASLPAGALRRLASCLAAHSFTGSLLSAV